MTRISRYPKNPDGSPMVTEAFVIQRPDGTFPLQITNGPRGMDNNPLPMRAMVLVNEEGGLVIPDQGLFVEDYRRAGYNDTQTLTAAFAAWLLKGYGDIWLDEERIYTLDATSTPNFIWFNLNGIRGGRIMGQGSTIMCDANGVQAVVFYLFNYRYLSINNLYCENIGDISGSVGAKLILVDAGVSSPSEMLYLNDVRALHCNTWLGVNPGGAVLTNRIKGIFTDAFCYAEKCFYGMSFANNGDYVEGFLKVKDGARFYLPHGIKDHKLKFEVEMSNYIKTETGIDVESGAPIKTDTLALPIENLKIDIDISGDLRYSPDTGVTPGCIVVLEHESDDATIIQDVEINLRVDSAATDPYDAHSVSFRALNAAEAIEATTAKIWRDIKLNGQPINKDGTNIHSYSIPTVRTVVELAGGFKGSPEKISAPNFAFNVGFGREIFVKIGDLVAEPYVNIDFSLWKDGPVDFKVTSMLYGAPNGTNRTRLDDVVHGMVSAGAYAHGSVTNETSWDAGVAATLTHAATGGNYTLTAVAAGGEYSNADSYAIVAIEYQGSIG